MFAWFNFVMFLSLCFVYARLWMLAYLQFAKYGLAFIGFTVTTNKFGKCVLIWKSPFSYISRYKIEPDVRRCPSK